MGKGMEKLRNFSEFLRQVLPANWPIYVTNIANTPRQEELDIDMNYTVKSCEELQVSYSLDISKHQQSGDWRGLGKFTFLRNLVSLAYDHIISNHETILTLANEDRMTWMHVGEVNFSTSFSLLYLLNREVENEGFGRFMPHNKKADDYYYQDVHLIISKVERRLAEPEVNYYKYVTSLIYYLCMFYTN